MQFPDTVGGPDGNTNAFLDSFLRGNRDDQPRRTDSPHRDHPFAVTRADQWRKEGNAPGNGYRRWMVSNGSAAP